MRLRGLEPTLKGLGKAESTKETVSRGPGWCDKPHLQSWLLAATMWFTEVGTQTEPAPAFRVGAHPPCQWWPRNPEGKGTRPSAMWSGAPPPPALSLTLHCALPGRSKPAATCPARLSENKGTEVSGEARPTAHTEDRQDSNLAKLEDPCAIKAIPWAAPGDATVPGGRRKQCWRPRGKPRQPRPYSAH